jgi:hypothetical protein
MNRTQHHFFALNLMITYAKNAIMNIYYMSKIRIISVNIIIIKKIAKYIKIKK